MTTRIFAGLALLLFSSAVSASKPIQFKRMDKNHSTIAFSVSIMKGMSKVTGKFRDFEAEIVYDEEDVRNSSIRITIDLSTVDTGIDDRDKHLKSADFLHADHSSKAEFISKRIEERGSELVVIGDFSLRGISKEIQMLFHITGLNKHESKKTPGEMRATLGATANFKIDRKEYGIKWQHDSVEMFVSDEVTIEINLLTRSTKIE